MMDNCVAAYKSAQAYLSLKRALFNKSDGIKNYGVTMWDNDGSIFQVVVNDERQFSIWPKERGIPDGWVDAGFSGSKYQCREYIDKAWDGICPFSVKESASHL